LGRPKNSSDEILLDPSSNRPYKQGDWGSEACNRFDLWDGGIEERSFELHINYIFRFGWVQVKGSYT